MINYTIDQILRDPSRVYDELMRTNPQFAEFVRANRGKDINQIARDNNINIDLFNSIRKGERNGNG